MNNRSKVKRSPSRGIYDTEEINAILDANFLCHVGFIYDGYPVVIPTMYGRYGNSLLIHGASTSRMINGLEEGVDVCISIAKVNGLVLARSAFHHSLNYESVVIFGNASFADPQKKVEHLKVISEHLIKNRWDEVRPPSQKELKATKIVEIKINEASAKVRKGPPIDDVEDMQLDVWAGILPSCVTYADAVPTQDLKANTEIPASVIDFLNENNSTK